ncbi:SAM-dependent methyltransferase [Natronospira proteinivora]|uniref:SAM-dependent methyltransferase n=1 Tax=Natronospira proteinivora TaxID=1807133 RepID=A0ABT1G996_9GAMM|nr:class I SAM-dependent methyltransferase [Natronospira proteinivora]MCP1727895.1 SAM-dependent methyltransferase [Natronospira proteinivora]
MEKWYPKKILAGEFAEKYNKTTIDFIEKHSGLMNVPDKGVLRFAEIGIWKGGTSFQLARLLGKKGELFLFDYEDNVDYVAENLKKEGYKKVRRFGSTQRFLDSYNWPLGKLMDQFSYPIFDYVYLDGAHTWAVDALTFFLADRLLKPGGYFDFDDYGWRLRGSSLDPEKISATADMYTDEQIEARQVEMIVERLVRRSGRYTELVKNKIFRKEA